LGGSTSAGGLRGEFQATSKARWKARVFGEVSVEGMRGTEEVEREGRTSGDDEVTGVREGPGTHLLGF